LAVVQPYGIRLPVELKTTEALDHRPAAEFPQVAAGIKLTANDCEPPWSICVSLRALSAFILVKQFLDASVLYGRRPAGQNRDQNGDG
jgi:hypothetical protein